MHLQFYESFLFVTEVKNKLCGKMLNLSSLRKTIDAFAIKPEFGRVYCKIIDSFV